MRIVLLSDVHANLAALRAVAGALRGEGPLDGAVVAGDLLTNGPRPRETWALLQELGWTLVGGDHDAALAVADWDRIGEVTFHYDPPGFRFRRAAAAQHAWSYAALDAATRDAVARLPPVHRVATPAGDLLVVHAAVHPPLACCQPECTAEALAAAYAATGAAVVAFGHHHGSFVRPTPFALLLNVAAVGLPLTGLAAYTLLTATRDGWVVEQRHAPYDPAEEAAAAQRAGFPPWVTDEPGG